MNHLPLLLIILLVLRSSLSDSNMAVAPSNASSSHGLSLSLPLHCSLPSVLKRIPFRSQRLDLCWAVRVVLCCSHLQLPLALLPPRRLLLLVPWRLPDQGRNPRWATTSVLGSTVALHLRDRRSHGPTVQISTVHDLRSSKCSLSQMPCLGLAVPSGQQGATASPARAALLQAHGMPHGAVPR